MSYRIDFTDRGVPDVYGDMAEDCVNALSSFYDNMEEICRSHSYKPMVDFTNNIQHFYAEDFRSHVMSCFEQWDNSGSSIPALARNIHAGSGAETTGRRFMADLRERLEGMFSRGFAPVRVNEDAPALEEKDINQMGECIRKFRMSAMQAKDNAIARANLKSGDNMLYSLITPVLKNTGESLCECFDSMLKAVLEGTELYMGGVERALNDLISGSSMDTSNVVRWPADEIFY